MSEQIQKPSVRKRLGEFILYFIFVAADAWEFWNPSHLLCLGIALAGLFALLLYDGLSWMKLAAVMTVATACSAIILAAAPPHILPEVEVLGSIRPGNESTPPDGCDKYMSRIPRPFQTEPFRIKAAETAIAHTKFGRFVVLQIGTCEALTIEHTATGISFAAYLYTRDGKLVAWIKDGTLHVMTGETVRQDRNGDFTTLRLTDGEGKEMFYLHYSNPNSLQVRGTFGCPNNPSVVIGDKIELVGDTTGAAASAKGACLADNLKADIYVGTRP